MKLDMQRRTGIRLSRSYFQLTELIVNTNLIFLLKVKKRVTYIFSREALHALLYKGSILYIQEGILLLTKVIISGTAYLDKNALITRPLPINLLQTLYYLGTFGIHASMALKRGLASFIGYQLDNSLAAAIAASASLDYELGS